MPVKRRLISALLVSAAFALGLPAPASATSVGSLAPLGCIGDIPSGPDECAEATGGLSDVVGVAVSPDGASVYAVSFSDDSLVHFSRDTQTGELTPVGCIADEDEPAGSSDPCAQSAPGLSRPGSVAVSPDGASVYVTSADESIAIFSREAESGELTPSGCVRDVDFSQDDCEQAATGLYGAVRVEISPDGEWVYVAAFGDENGNGGALTTFARNPDGSLTPHGCIEHGGLTSSCLETAPGLYGAFYLETSPDGRFLYIGAQLSDTLAVFKLAEGGGSPVFKGCFSSAKPAPTWGCEERAGAVLGGSLAISPDGRTLYTARGAIVEFDRNFKNGGLDPQGCIEDREEARYGCLTSSRGLSSLSNVIAPTRRSVYAEGRDSDAVWHFARSPQAGRITPADCVADLENGAARCRSEAVGLKGGLRFAASPDGRHLYGVSYADNVISTFEVECSTRSAGTSGSDQGPNALRGTEASDLLAGLEGGDDLLGGEGNDCLEGGAGPDRLWGEGGEDLAVGAAGDDVIRLRDESKDEARCGAGDDLAIVDGNDEVHRSCERERVG